MIQVNLLSNSSVRRLTDDDEMFRFQLDLMLKLSLFVLSFLLQLVLLEELNLKGLMDHQVIRSLPSFHDFSIFSLNLFVLTHL